MTLSRLYTKHFIGLYVDHGTIHVSVLSFKNPSEISVEESSFIATTPPSGLVEYLQKFHDSTPYCYTSLLNTLTDQGSVATCTLSKAIELDERVRESKTVCIDDEWMNYITQESYAKTVESFSAIEPDMLFSPFSLIHLMFREYVGEKHTVFTLLLNESATVVIAKNRSIRAAKQFNLADGDLSSQIGFMLGKYYDRPCCRGEFVESVYIADAGTMASSLAESLEKLLLVEVTTIEVLPAQLCAILGAKELGYEPQFS